MARAIELAACGLGRTSPNPMVGCVLVRDGVVVGEGYHRQAGSPHAEVEALRAAGDRARGATAYVSLEPCCHTGRTGPCVDALLAAGVRRVVAAHLDPNPRVAGQGRDKLLAAGVAVEVGLLADAARRLNQPYLKWRHTGRPLVTLKAAVSLDGRLALASRERGWLTGEASRAEVHRRRDQADAILAGGETIRRDDPALTTRLHEGTGRDARRVIVSARLAIPEAARAVPGALIFAATQHAARAGAFEARGAEVVLLPEVAPGRLELGALLEELGRRELCSVLCEGGGQLHGALLAGGHADRLLLFVAPLVLGHDGVPLFAADGAAELARAPRLHRVRHTTYGSDVLIEGDFSAELH